MSSFDQDPAIHESVWERPYEGEFVHMAASIDQPDMREYIYVARGDFVTPDNYIDEAILDERAQAVLRISEKLRARLVASTALVIPFKEEQRPTIHRMLDKYTTDL